MTVMIMFQKLIKIRILNIIKKNPLKMKNKNYKLTKIILQKFMMKLKKNLKMSKNKLIRADKEK